MNPELHCFSFHSVKGGVGKSTLSTLLAHVLAARRPDTPVFLIDMDLTGTSLSDVLPLEAPRWPSGRVEPLTPPTDFWSRESTLKRIDDRKGGPRSADELLIPYLNDYLLWADPDWSTDRDVLPSALAWRMVGAPDNLRVIPSSALPGDLQRIMPVIFDEEHAAFLEARIEALLDSLIAAFTRCIVVFDTPPTIPGLSHSILSLAFRLGGPTKLSLAEDDYMPGHLDNAAVRWKVALVLSTDRQDLRAAQRWMMLVDDQQQTQVRLVVNRVHESHRANVEVRLFGGDLGPEGYVDPDYPTLANFSDIRIVPDDARMRLFGHDDIDPGTLVGLLDPADWLP